MTREAILPWPPRTLNPNTRWSAEMDAHLSALAGSMSHREIGVVFGKTEKAVRNRCWRLGISTCPEPWTSDEVARLQQAYSGAVYGAQINLDALAHSLGRMKSNVCRKARDLGLTNIARPLKAPEDRRIRRPMFETKEALSKHISGRVKSYLKEHGHPKGSLGMKHTPETKAKISESSRLWNASLTLGQKAASSLKAMKTKVERGTYVMERPRGSWKAAWREIGGIKKYYRSKWEANYAYYLQWLKEKGQIADWKHEPKVFWFEGIKRGTNSYLPDFWVQENSGAEAFHEVKGWMDDRSKTKIKRMAKYHPKVKLIVIDSKGYAAIKKSISSLVPGWEA